MLNFGQVDISLVVNWMSRFFPLFLFFLYVLMRAAHITEKAGQVAPLVNSWGFQGEGEDIP